VKVVLCDRCIKKLMYKRMKDKEASGAARVSKVQEDGAAAGTDTADTLPEDTSRSRSSAPREQWEISHAERNGERRRDHSRSRSPIDRHHGKRRGHRRSRSP